jgi:hypothetical protein
MFGCRPWTASSPPFLGLKGTSLFLQSQPQPDLQVVSQLATHELEPVLEHQRLMRERVRRLPTQLPKTKLERPWANLLAGLKLRNPLPMVLLCRLLLQDLRRRFQSIDQAGIPNFDYP